MTTRNIKWFFRNWSKLVSIFLHGYILVVLIGCAHNKNQKPSLATPVSVASVLDKLEFPLSCTNELQNQNDAWKKFRTDFAYHIQGVSIVKSGEDEKNCQFVIVSEPPPHITLEDLQGIYPNVFNHAQLKKQQIGVDGWVQDIVAPIPHFSNDEQTEFVEYLHQVLFGTRYGAEKISSSAQKSGSTLDLRISAAEMESWVFKEDVTFVSIEDQSVCSIHKVLAEASNKVFVSKQPGLVIWSIPTLNDFAASAKQARYFAVASDLVIGSIVQDDILLLIGRQRIEPQSVLPPLRVETLVLLASLSQNAELAQSFERNHVLAGTLSGGQNWAPIFLSNELRDTEFGSLLNITDQLLKGWSNNGRTVYKNFAYAAPDTWPFEAPIPEVAGKVSSLVYNWNTEGFGAVTKINDRSYYVTDRTGVLPISYLPTSVSTVTSSEFSRLEEIGRNWFAKIEDPNLVRVAQYTAIYQSFHQFGIFSEWQWRTRDTNERKRMQSQYVNTVIQKIHTETAAQHKKQIVSLMDRQFDALQRKGVLPDNIDLAATKKANVEIGVVIVSKIKQILSAVQPELLPTIVEQLADRHAPITSGDAFSAYQATKAISQLPVQMVLSAFTQTDSVKDAYVVSNNSTPGTWIHTPSVVVSWNTEELGGAQGGHNVTAKSTIYEPSTKILRGGIETLGDVTYYHPEDIKSLKVGKFPRIKQSAVRTQAIALGYSSSSLSPKLAIAKHPAIPAIVVEDLILVSKTSDTEYEVAVGKETFFVSSIPDLTDAVANLKFKNINQDVIIHTRKMSENDSRKLARNIQVQLRANYRQASVATINHKQDTNLKKRVTNDKQVGQIADIEVSPVVVNKTGDNVFAIHIPLKVTESTGITYKLKAVLSLAGKIPGNFVARVQTIVNAFSARVKGKPKAAPDVGKALKKELHNLLREQGKGRIEVIIEAFSDNYWVYNDKYYYFRTV